MGTEQNKRQYDWRELLARYGTIFGFFTMCIIFALLSDVFLKYNNILNILLQSTMLAIISFGLTIVIISGEFDASLSSIVALSGVITTLLLSNGWGIIPAFLVGLLPGIVIGFLNAIAVLWLGVSSFIATLGMMSSVTGIVYMITQGRSIWQSIPEDYLWLGRGYFIGIPVPVITLALLFLLLWFFLTQTNLGRKMYAVGGNAEAARLSGINVRKIRMLAFIIGGFLAALCGVLLASRLGSGQPTAGGTYFLDAIAATFLGQSIFSKGKPHLTGTLIGVLIIGTMNNGFVLLGMSYYIQDLIKGLVIVLAVAVATIGAKNKNQYTVK